MTLDCWPSLALQSCSTLTLLLLLPPPLSPSPIPPYPVPPTMRSPSDPTRAPGSPLISRLTRVRCFDSYRQTRTLVAQIFPPPSYAHVQSVRHARVHTHIDTHAPFYIAPIIVAPVPHPWNVYRKYHVLLWFVVCITEMLTHIHVCGAEANCETQTSKSRKEEDEREEVGPTE